MSKLARSIYKSISLTTQMLHRQGLKEALPVFGFLLVIMLILICINSFAPLVPFVYSLF